MSTPWENDPIVSDGDTLRLKAPITGRGSELASTIADTDARAVKLAAGEYLGPAYPNMTWNGEKFTPPSGGKSAKIKHPWEDDPEVDPTGQVKSEAMKGLEAIEPSSGTSPEQEPTTGEKIGAGAEALKTTLEGMLSYPAAVALGAIEKIRQPSKDFEASVMEVAQKLAPPPTSKLGQDYQEKLAKVLDPLNAFAPGVLHAAPISPRIALSRARANLAERPISRIEPEIKLPETSQPKPIEVATPKAGALPELPQDESTLIPGSEKLPPHGETPPTDTPLPVLPIEEGKLHPDFVSPKEEPTAPESKQNVEALNSASNIIDLNKSGKLNEAQTIQQLQQFANQESFPPELRKQIEQLAQQVPKTSKMGGVGKKQGGAVRFLFEEEPPKTDTVGPSQEFIKSIDTLQQKIDQLVTDAGAAPKELPPTPSPIAAPLGQPLGASGFGKGQRGAVDFGFADWVSDKLTKKEPEVKPSGDNLASEIVPINTRLGNIHPELQQISQRFDKDVSKLTGDRIHAGDEFLTKINKLPKQEKIAVNEALLGNDREAVQTFSKGKNLSEPFDRLNKTLDDVGKEAIQYGVLDKDSFRKDYFPTRVKDYKGLLKEIGIDKATELQKRINEAKQRANKGGYDLSPQDISTVVNKYLSNPRVSSIGGKSGFTKGRVFETIPENLRKFYETPTETYHTYMQEMTTKIEMAKFFGKDAIKDQTTQRLNVDQSIGAMSNRLAAEGKVHPADFEKVQSLLQARFGNHGAIHPWMQIYRDVTNMALLGDVKNAVSQIPDAIVSPLVTAGIRPTLQAWVLSATPKKFLANKYRTAKDLGLTEHISEEFAGERPTTKVVRGLFKRTLLAPIDTFGKNVNLIANRIAKEAEAKGSNLEKTRLYQKYAPRFGERFPQLVDDLKNGRVSDLTDEVIWSELAGSQPISKGENIKVYSTHPNVGRGGSTLKSFLVKQLDFWHDNTVKEFKRGNIKAGIRNTMILAIAAGYSQMGIQNLKDLMENKPSTWKMMPQEIPLALLDMLGVNKFFSGNIRNNGIGKSLLEFILPPVNALDPLEKDARQALINVGAGKATKNIPLVGDYFKGKKQPVKGESVKLIPFAGDEIYGQIKAGQGRRKKLAKEERKARLGG